ncbi:MAG: ribosome-recycling factor [Candidatus Daviesbacteria bacterium]|nr:ribosome-recycling factor [Candidatus Daviesbacteria bacterium]
MDPVLNEANTSIQSAIEHLKHELSSIRVGRANPAFIENIPVEAYDTRLKLLEVANISAPQPNLLTVQVWDASIVHNVVKAIQEANLGLNPSFEGAIIRLPIPPLTAERREELIKVVHLKKEETKINFRQIRQDIRAKWEQEKEADVFGEDEWQRREKILQELIEKSTVFIEELGKDKVKELTEL